jgi:cytochrome c6
MFKRIVNIVEVMVLVGAAVFVVMLFANEPSAPSARASGPGAELFAANCARCHGADGGGGLGPGLSGGRVLTRFPDPADETAFVTRGAGTMPAFGRILTPEQIRQVVDYTRNGLG